MRFVFGLSIGWILAGGGPIPASDRPVECLRAVRCVTQCGGVPVTNGCASCRDGTFDDMMCLPDGGMRKPR